MKVYVLELYLGSFENLETEILGVFMSEDLAKKAGENKLKDYDRLLDDPRYYISEFELTNKK